MPRQLNDEVLRSLHGELGKHPGIVKAKIAHKEKYFYPITVQLIRERVMSCEQCIKESRIYRRVTRPPLINPNANITAPKDAMQTDLVPKLSSSGGYDNIVTAMGMFSYSFAYPTSNHNAKTIVEVIFNIMTKHAYLPTSLISDKGSAFVSHVIRELAAVFGNTLKHAFDDLGFLTIGLFERSHASTKQVFKIKIKTGYRRSLWHEGVSISVLNYYTSYHTSIGCEPNRVGHRRSPFNVFVSKLGIRPQQAPVLTSQIAQVSCSWPNGDDLSLSSQKCHASLHQR